MKGGYMQKFWHGVKEWFADAADHIQLFCLEQRIESLNEELEWENNRAEREKIICLMDLVCEAYNKVLSRVRARDDRHAVAHAHR